MVAVLTGMGITMMMTAELEDSYTDLRFSPHGTAFLTDAIIMQRYIEIAGSTAARHGRRERCVGALTAKICERSRSRKRESSWAGRSVSTRACYGQPGVDPKRSASDTSAEATSATRITVDPTVEDTDANKLVKEPSQDSAGFTEEFENPVPWHYAHDVTGPPRKFVDVLN
jgi:hypothetical protein